MSSPSPRVPFEGMPLDGQLSVMPVCADVGIEQQKKAASTAQTDAMRTRRRYFPKFCTKVLPLGSVWARATETSRDVCGLRFLPWDTENEQRVRQAIGTVSITARTVVTLGYIVKRYIDLPRF